MAFLNSKASFSFEGISHHMSASDRPSARKACPIDMPFNVGREKTWCLWCKVAGQAPFALSMNIITYGAMNIIPRYPQ